MLLLSSWTTSCHRSYFPSIILLATAAARSFAAGMVTTTSTTTPTTAPGMFSMEQYQAPAWCTKILPNVPKHRVRLAHLPTPFYELSPHLWSLSSTFGTFLKENRIRLFVKRDDCSGGIELGGNKIRKLEFLLADALSENHKKYDCVVTIGGEQSNHCRATAAAARMVGLEPHLILRASRQKSVDRTHNNNNDNNTHCDLGHVGNLFVDRLVGSTIYACTPGEYGRIGSDELVKRVCHYIQTNLGKTPYPIPVGGSNGLGTWGYVEAVQEFQSQWQQQRWGAECTLDHVVFACGSGGTATGITLGMALYQDNAHNNNNSYNQQEDASSSKNTVKPQVHAIAVCDNEEYFYQRVTAIAEEMGYVSDKTTTNTTEDFVRQHLTVHNGKGLGYAISTPEELEFVASFARETGIVLDPVYSGKALYRFYKIMSENPEGFRDSNVLFWHTGGALGLYDKANEMMPLLQCQGPCLPLDVYGKKKRGTVDISRPSEL